MKKLTAMLLVLTMCASMLIGCGSKEEEPAVGMANPMEECDFDDLALKTGIELQAPEGAEDVVYYTISVSEDGEDGAIAQMDFTLDGVSYTHRAITKDNGTLEEVAGTYFTNAKDEGVSISERDGALYTGDGMCAVIWWDRVPGITYTLSTSDNEDGDALLQVAEKVFVPLQGDAE